MHYVRVTLVTGQQLTITVEIPPGTPVDQIQIPGLPAAVASIVDLGSTETTPTPTATQAPTVTATPTQTATATPDDRRPRTRPAATARRRTRARQGRQDQGEGRGDDRATPATRRPAAAEHRVADGQGRGARRPDAERPPPTTDADAATALRPRRTTRRTRSPSRARRKIGVPNFFIDKFRIPPFLLPIYQAAGTQYGIRWELLAAINEIETDYGRNLNVSSAGAQGWMQFMPADVEGLRRRRQQRRPDGPVQPGRRDLRRRALPEGRRRRQGHPRRDLRLQPRRLVRRLRAAARAGHRRHAGQPRRLAHRPDRGPLPGRRAGDLRGRGLQAQPEGDGLQPCQSRSRVRRAAASRSTRRRLAGRRGQRRAGDPDRRSPSASAASSRSRTPTATRTRTGAWPRSPSSTPRPSRRRSTRPRSSGLLALPKPDAKPTEAAASDTDRARLARAPPRRPQPAPRQPDRPSRPTPRAARAAGQGAPVRATRRARTRRPPAAPSRSSCAPAGSTAR